MPAGAIRRKEQPMRTVTYGAAASLDGFITARDGGLGWLRHSPDVNEIMKAYWAKTDTLLFGRKTWEFAAAAGGGGGSMKGIRSVLFSRTLAKSPHRDVELVRENAGDFVRSLKAQPGKNILVMSGGNLAASLLAEGVVDEVGVNVHPVLLGAGVSLFNDCGRQVDLTLKECRPISGGCVLLSYAVGRPQVTARRGTSARRGKAARSSAG
jgi:dihydrofolate reductase